MTGPFYHHLYIAFPGALGKFAQTDEFFDLTDV
jgi:hypothetical protein